MAPNSAASVGKRRFFVEMIKPSHYDDDGYVIQWLKAWIPSNSLSCLYGLGLDFVAAGGFGDDVEIVLNGTNYCCAFHAWPRRGWPTCFCVGWAGKLPEQRSPRCCSRFAARES